MAPAIVLVWRPLHASCLSCHVVSNSGADTGSMHLCTPHPVFPGTEPSRCWRIHAGRSGIAWKCVSPGFGSPPLGLPYSEEGQRVGRRTEAIHVVFVYLGPTWHHLPISPSVQAGCREAGLLCPSGGHRCSSEEAALSKGKDKVPVCRSSSLPSSPSD